MKDALKLALEALESGVDTQIGRVAWTEYDSCLINKAITAIKEALAQPDHEVDWKDQYEKQRRRAEMWRAKLEEVVGPSPMAYPLAQPDYRAVKTYHEGKPVYVSQPEQAWPENDWDGHVDILNLILLVRADAMQAATRAANESWTLLAKALVLAEREKVVAEFTEAEQEPEQTAIEQEHKDLRTPKERRAEGQWHCPECFTFGSTHRKECAAAVKARENT